MVREEPIKFSAGPDHLANPIHLFHLFDVFDECGISFGSKYLVLVDFNVVSKDCRLFSATVK